MYYLWHTCLIKFSLHHCCLKLPATSKAMHTSKSVSCEFRELEVFSQSKKSLSKSLVECGSKLTSPNIIHGDIKTGSFISDCRVVWKDSPENGWRYGSIVTPWQTSESQKFVISCTSMSYSWKIRSVHVQCWIGGHKYSVMADFVVTSRTRESFPKGRLMQSKPMFINCRCSFLLSSIDLWRVDDSWFWRSLPLHSAGYVCHVWLFDVNNTIWPCHRCESLQALPVSSDGNLMSTQSSIWCILVVAFWLWCFL